MRFPGGIRPIQIPDIGGKQMANTDAKLLAGALLALSWAHVVAADDAVVVGGEGNHCGEDPGCTNPYTLTHFFARGSTS